ncbi:1,4-alpha-glucan branching protein domain-containing protein [Bacillus sp. 3255]|uniref:1,4-alpha-glucan branching protein domain-containing protein n=1 Tax=Bacillus sp. 3255 TaxID=2817904 RepID=UPI0028595A11|nr:1,4-alpha-glucan branching protein domain-containing protein [Bacillus sp. 3255]MDR6878549.1 1,4-alpha-glucan branching enzyme [Bacillus sp. 3255]
MIDRIKPKPEPKGYFALVLHAHLPYLLLREQETLEAPWFIEAMTGTYLPILDVIQQLVQDETRFRITLALTPTLLSLFSDPLLQAKYRRALSERIAQAEEQVRSLMTPSLLPLAKQHALQLQTLQTLYESFQGNLIAAFKHYQELGYVEIVTSAATHAYLPLMSTAEGVRAQVLTAVRDYERHFGLKPRGMWLPGCGYTPGLERILKQAGIRYFFTDALAVQFASPQPLRGLLAPTLTPYGVMAFPCGSAAMERAGQAASRASKDDAGIPLHPLLALEKAGDDADAYIAKLGRQAVRGCRWLDREPLITAAYDAELFGQGRQQGPLFLDQLCRKLFHEHSGVKMVTPGEYLEEYESAGTAQLNESSLGRESLSHPWLHGGCDWIYRHLHQAEKRMVQLATSHEHLARHGKLNAAVLKRALNQAARELMLAQSSDWALMMRPESVLSEYAAERTTAHLGCFHRLCDQIERQTVDESWLASIEEADRCLPDIHYRDYVSIRQLSPVPIMERRQDWDAVLAETQHNANVFMLAWEYPPKQVGGLSKAVHELAEALAARGEIVHVVTTAHDGAPSFEKMNGVYVHRLPVEHSGPTPFYHWTFELNLAMTDHLVRWHESGGRIDLLHAHDWMVFHAAREIKTSYGIPLIATIHATEWGRNQGHLHSELQRNIHEIEWKLTYEANRVFVCSSYMKEEIVRIFQLPVEKVSVHHNGIRLPAPTDASERPPALAGEDPIIFYIGRLVYEKGVHVLIEAMPSILAQVPQAKLVIAGSGPMEPELRAAAARLHDRVLFTGFIDDDYRAQLYRAASVCVIPSLYEPFGIVALEAMAHRKPLVLSDTGGLAEIIRHGVDGYKALPGHADSLSWHITELLLQPRVAVKLADSAYNLLQKRYQWDRIAQEIQEEYRKLTYELVVT